MRRFLIKALLLSSYRHLEMRDLPKPQPGPDEVLIQVAACGICGSDVHGYDGSTGRRIPPLVMGHEAAGIIAAVGSAVHNLSPGDRVTFDSTVYCGVCDDCQRGRVNLCKDRQVVGVSCGEYSRAGAFAEFLVVPARVVYLLPEDLSFPEAAMLEAVSVALHGASVSEMSGGEVVLVLGAGMIGLLLLQAARAAGASLVYVADVDETRLNIAMQLGADRTFLASNANWVEEVLRATDQRGVDVVMEAVGREQTIRAAVDCVRNGGTITLVGNLAPQVTLPLQKIVSRQLRLQGSCASAGEYPEAMAMIESKKIKVAPLITAVAPLREGSSWFERLHASEPNLMKVVLDPRSEAAVESTRAL